jgi:anhydro-N-acetylmuramic acid kinase
MYSAIGLMTGTSFDGIDLAYLQSDGIDKINLLKHCHLPYLANIRDKIRKIMQKKVDVLTIKELEQEITIIHADLVLNFLHDNQISSQDIDFLGFHGQTICHNAKKQLTWQLGNPQLLATLTKIKVIADFRSKDLAYNGQGAPLVPIYHYNLFKNINFSACPFVVLNIGGIANLTYCCHQKQQLIAFDFCFGNAPFDDFMHQNFQQNFDKNGIRTQVGKVNLALCEKISLHPIFNSLQSFHRQDFHHILQEVQSNLVPRDILANYATIFALVLKNKLQTLPQLPENLILCGGGRKNIGITLAIKQQLNELNIYNSDDIGFNGDSIEAEAFAYLAIRSHLNLPISFPTTTQVKQPISGGCTFLP